MNGREILQSRLGVDPAVIDDYCRRWGIKELSLFGSIVGEDFRPDSDVDVLVTFIDSNRSFGPWWGELQDMQDELARALSRRVDFVLRDSVERSENYIRRRSILNSLVPIYVA